MPRVNLTVAMLESMRTLFIGSRPDMVLELEEASGTDAFGIIVRCQPVDDAWHKFLVTDYGTVRIA